MASKNHSVATITNPAEDADLLPRHHCIDDLRKLHSAVSAWANENRVDELAVVMQSAKEVLDVGWTEVHESLAMLSVAQSCLKGRHLAEAKQAIEAAQEYLRRWNGAAMRFEKPAIDANTKQIAGGRHD